MSRPDVLIIMLDSLFVEFLMSLLFLLGDTLF